MATSKNISISIEGAKCIEVDGTPSSGDKIIDISNTGDKVIETSVSGGKVIEISCNRSSKPHKESPSKKRVDRSSSSTVISDIIHSLQSSGGASITSGSSLYKSIYCPNCGKKYYMPNSRYCTQCGRKRK